MASKSSRFSLEKFSPPTRRSWHRPPRAGEKTVMRDVQLPSGLVTWQAVNVPILTDDELLALAGDLTDEEVERLAALRAAPHEIIRVQRRKLLRRAGPHETKLGSTPADHVRSVAELRALYYHALAVLSGDRDSVFDSDEVADKILERLGPGKRPPEAVAKARQLVEVALAQPRSRKRAFRVEVAARRVVRAFLADQGFTLSDDRLRRLVADLRL